ncbi:diguanylate cyclase (GGDEF)-like protein [Clostridium moniliforme]|uniref:Diguanylate cyclase (GGDEF)-like protein n=1 Tax=Clostridium moniliforme TaxID=39489 RepID=A0ABS4EZH6_9CLOT|nr:GGDEF domain-containing protein [Clostridium moniliforme]MBP1889404.1 diguanylate cyclase (GGDEF)-like protein [Clostridium moniliforme]
MNLLNEIKERLKPFKNLYDFIRIVDPINNKVINSDNEKLGLKFKDFSCYKFWGKNKKCENCISYNAYLENNTFVKLEVFDSKIFLVIASPFISNDKTYIVELLKDISKTSFFNTGESNQTIDSLMKSIETSLYKDELTGIYNKRVIYEKLEKLISLNISPISLIMLDIDLFKSINDNYGHIIGDKVLKFFASVIDSCIKNKNHYLGRFGGEEFIIVLANSNMKDGTILAEKIRKTVEKSTYDKDNLNIKLSCSLGGYTIKHNNNISTEDFINLADRNLYIAKRNGRNTTIFSEET